MYNPFIIIIILFFYNLYEQKKNFLNLFSNNKGKKINTVQTLSRSRETVSLSIHLILEKGKLSYKQMFGIPTEQNI